MRSLALSRGLAIAIGAAYQWVAAAFWGYYVVINPIQDILVREHGAVTYAHDLVVNLLIATPFAAVFRHVSALRSWSNVAIAVCVALLLTYGSSLGSLAGLMGVPRFWAGVVFISLSLPLAFFALNLVGNARPENGKVQDAA